MYENIHVCILHILPQGIPLLTDDVDGRMWMEMQAIQCPVGNTTLEYKFQGSGTYYIKLQVRNAR